MKAPPHRAIVPYRAAAANANRSRDRLTFGRNFCRSVLYVARINPKSQKIRGIEANLPVQTVEAARGGDPLHVESLAY